MGLLSPTGNSNKKCKGRRRERSEYCFPCPLFGYQLSISWCNLPSLYTLCPYPVTPACSWPLNTECPHSASSNLSQLPLSVCSYQLMVLLTSAPGKLLLALVLCGHLCKRIYKYYLSIPVPYTELLKPL